MYLPNELFIKCENYFKKMQMFYSLLQDYLNNVNKSCFGIYYRERIYSFFVNILQLVKVLQLMFIIISHRKWEKSIWTKNFFFSRLFQSHEMLSVKWINFFVIIKTDVCFIFSGLLKKTLSSRSFFNQSYFRLNFHKCDIYVLFSYFVWREKKIFVRITSFISGFYVYFLFTF